MPQVRIDAVPQSQTRSHASPHARDLQVRDYSVHRISGHLPKSI